MEEEVVGEDDERAGGDAFSVGFKSRGAKLAADRMEWCAEAQLSVRWTALWRDKGLCSLMKEQRSGLKEAKNSSSTIFFFSGM